MIALPPIVQERSLQPVVALAKGNDIIGKILREALAARARVRARLRASMVLCKRAAPNTHFSGHGAKVQLMHVCAVFRLRRVPDLTLTVVIA